MCVINICDIQEDYCQKLEERIYRTKKELDEKRKNKQKGENNGWIEEGMDK